MPQDFTKEYKKNIELLDNALRVKESFDIVCRDFFFAEKTARVYFVDGLVKDDSMVKVIQSLQALTPEKTAQAKDARSFANHFISYIETDVSGSLETATTFVLSGALCLIVEGYEQAIIIDARTYPARSVGEPENDKVLRGAHDGFTETMIFNTALIRRRLRNPQLTVEYMNIGTSSHTDTVICYIADKVDKNVLNQIREKISNIKIKNLSMGQATLAESLLKKQHFNPFPKVRYTERPDAAAASINEGNIVILVDNSPSAMIVPTGIFDFLQDANDYYFPPLIGSYLRIIRMIIFALTLLLTPIWLLLIQNEQVIPPWLEFIKIQDEYLIPPFAQLLIVEIIIDALKLASLNTPSALSNSLSVVGALVLGEFAVQSGWLSSEVVLYMAFVGITNFTQPSFELGYAFKLCRMMLTVLVALFNLWGFIAGMVIIILLILFNPTITGRCYLYPLIPFNWQKLSSLLIRKRINKNNN
ncbi:MAG: spore germination protein [Clostridia bacterium]|nr:spore germination protein [Clostridia bacterium]